MAYMLQTQLYLSGFVAQNNNKGNDYIFSLYIENPLGKPAEVLQNRSDCMSEEAFWGALSS